MDNGASNDSHTDITVDSAASRLPMQSSSITLDFFKHQLNADSRVRTHISLHLHTLLVVHDIIVTIIYILLLSFIVYVNISIL